MTTLAILNHAKTLNGKVIIGFESRIADLKIEASAWRMAGESAYFVDACKDARKYRAKLAKAVEKQKRIKVEIAALHRTERIQRKYLKVFGKLPQQVLTTSVEQERMLDTLIWEREQAEIDAMLAAKNVVAE